MLSKDTQANTTDADITNEAFIVAHYSLTITIFGTVFNTLTFIVLCRPTFRNTKARPTLHYMRTMAIFDILMLYGWNVDHYFSTMHGFAIQTLNMPFCKFFSFLNYFAAQSSAWLRVFVCVDRYLSLSRLHRTWFSQSKNVLIIIGSVMVCITIINFQIFIFGCSYLPDGSITVFSTYYLIYPTWDYVNLGVYNCAPFICMVTLNSGVIYHLIRLKRTSTIQNSRIQHRSISITLVITTLMFLAMTTPATIAYCFFVDTTSLTLLHFLDGLFYTYHILSFPLYVITFDEFRQEVFAILLCKPNDRRVAPMAGTGITPATQNGTRTTRG